MKKKRFFLSVVEEMVQNPKYKGYRCGRIEVVERGAKTYDGKVYEASFLVPDEMYRDFGKLFDMKEFDRLPRIIFDYKDKHREVRP